MHSSTAITVRVAGELIRLRSGCRTETGVQGTGTTRRCTRFGASLGGTVSFGDATDFEAAGTKVGDRLQVQVSWDDKDSSGAHFTLLVAKL